ncbi:MAG: heme utilization cystosolic carrier protein HutX [Desulfovibrio sp.]|uniref:heme utilization cystosolic carrier protein HutX n=1 Tax=Desulfovibrio sp. TaxID=885 RepID=UPI0039E2A145
MSDFVQVVRQKVTENPSVMLMSLAKELGRPEAEVVAALPEEMRVHASKNDFGAIWAAMTGWESSTFITIGCGGVVEVEGKLPQGNFMHGMFNLTDRQCPLGGHLFINKLEHIWFVSKPFFNKESHSVQFFDAAGDQMFAVYLGRNEQREIIPSVKEAYMHMRSEFAV